MHVIVYANQGMDQGMVMLQRKLKGTDIINARLYADMVADERDASIDESDGHVLSCSGDIRVVFTDFKVRTRVDADGYRWVADYPTRIWSGESFYFARD
jgi:hypothetical protein